MAHASRITRTLSLALLPVVAATFTLGCASAPVSGTQEDGSFREVFEAQALSMGTSNPPVIPPGTTATIQVNITRWTTAAERDALFSELKENGQAGLVSKLQQQDQTGWVVNRSTTRSSMTARAAAGTSAPSQRLRYAWEIDKGAGNRRIVAALDRPIGFAEASGRTHPRWRDHDLTLIVLDVNKKGEGQGQLAMGVQMELDPETKQLSIQNFGSEPVRLNNVRRR